MAIIITISIGDVQIRWNVLSLSFSERESWKWPRGLSDFYHNYLISNESIPQSGKITICNTRLSKSAVIRACSNFSNISVMSFKKKP